MGEGHNDRPLWRLGKTDRFFQVMGSLLWEHLTTLCRRTRDVDVSKTLTFVSNQILARHVIATKCRNETCVDLIFCPSWTGTPPPLQS